uniref:Uncharacterized protein n=1 Tax=Oryza brachyantha TaxID=4533 RepID=J3MZW9_ORYBR
MDRFQLRPLRSDATGTVPTSKWLDGFEPASAEERISRRLSQGFRREDALPGMRVPDAAGEPKRRRVRGAGGVGERRRCQRRDVETALVAKCFEVGPCPTQPLHEMARLGPIKY